MKNGHFTNRCLAVSLMFVIALLMGFVTPLSVQAMGQKEEEKITLTGWSFLDETDTDDMRGRGYRAVNDAFREKYPNVRLKTEVFPTNEIGDQLLMAATVGRGPDVVREESLWFQRHIEAGSVLALDRFVDKMPAGYRDDWIVPLANASHDGKLYALPLEARLALYWYRADVFEEKGLKVPETWEELGEITRVLTRDDKIGFGIALAQSHITDFNYWCNSQYTALDASILDEDYRAVFNSAAGVKIFSFLRDLVEKYNMSNTLFEMTGYEITAAFNAGILLSSSEGSHRVPSSRIKLGDKGTLKVAPPPGPYGPAPITTMGWFITMASTTENPEWAWKYMEHMTSPEMQALHAEVGGEMPTRISAFNEPFFVETEKGKEYSQWFTLPQKYGVSIQRKPLENRLLMRLLLMAAHEIVIGGEPVAQTLDKYAAKYNAEVGK